MGRIARQHSASGTDRCDQLLQDILQPPLDHVVAQPTAPIARLQIFHRRLVVIERVKLGEDDIALDLPGIFGPQMTGIGIHGLHGLADLIG